MAGGTPDSSVSSFYGGGIPWCSISDLSDSGKYLGTTRETLSKSGLEHSTAKLLPNRSILLAMYASIGKCAISTTTVTTSQAILGLFNFRDIDREFLYYYLCSIQPRLVNLGQTGTQSNLSKAIISNLDILVPPLADQRRIVLALNAVDTNIAGLSGLLGKLSGIKKSTLSLLMKPSNDWTSCEFREVCVPVQWHRQQIIPKRKKLVSVVTQGDDSEKQAISANRYFSIKEPLILFGDHTCLVKLLTSDCRIEGDGVKLFAPKDCDPVFLFHSIQMNASTIPIGYARHLNALRETPVCMPSLFEQRRIAATLATIDESIARIKAEWEKMSALKAGLMRYYFG